MEYGLFSEDEYNQIVCGCDEAGRGPLAGPVVASAVVLPPDFPFHILNDSKKMTEKERLLAESVIKEKAVCWAVTSVSHKTIDRINILQASMLAMKRSYEKIRNKARIDIVLVDGNKEPDIDIPCKAIVKGDQKIPEIMAASILAKTERDRLMKLADRKWPQYGYCRNMGYPTRKHIEAIEQYGPSPIARKTFHVKKKEEDVTPLLFRS